MNSTQKRMIENFQCLGCVAGGNVECGSCELDVEYGFSCKAHVLGTHMSGVGNFALGLPKGFNRPGPDDSRKDTRNRMDIRMWERDDAPEWNHLNVAVWAMEHEGYLFVRTFSPRTNRTFVDIVEGGTFTMVPNAVDVGTFIDDID